MHSSTNHQFFSSSSSFIKLNVTGISGILIRWRHNAAFWRYFFARERKKIDLHRLFRNLWHPLRELIVRLKIMKKSHINICPIRRRLQWVFCFNYFYKRCKETTTLHLKTSLTRVLSFIWLLSPSFLVFLEFVESHALFYFVVFQHVQSMLRIR